VIGRRVAEGETELEEPQSRYRNNNQQQDDRQSNPTLPSHLQPPATI
jgi:histone deacetylase complex regulatory component SIN3